jgi:hypothetical protein
VLFAESLDLSQVAVVGDHDAGFALDGLYEECGRVAAMALEDVAEVVNIVVANLLSRLGIDASNVWQIGTVILSRLGIG